jgi:hypothetical protein
MLMQRIKLIQTTLLSHDAQELKKNFQAYSLPLSNYKKSLKGVSNIFGLIFSRRWNANCKFCLVENHQPQQVALLGEEVEIKRSAAGKKAVD